MIGIKKSRCATPRGGFQFGRLVEPTHFTGYEPKTCIDISSEHAPINYSSKRHSFNTEYNDLTTTVAASEIPDGFQQLTAASGSQQASSSVVNPSHGADTCGAAPGSWCEVMSQFQVLKGLSREERQAEIWKVCKLCVKERSPCLL